MCKTNIVEGTADEIDDPKQPFLQRHSPPILIWRYLTEQCGVDPADDRRLPRRSKTHKDYPLPADFQLFKGGDKDYEDFTAGRLPARHLQPEPARGLGRPARLLRLHRQEHGVERPGRADHRPPAAPAGGAVTTRSSG